MIADVGTALHGLVMPQPTPVPFPSFFLRSATFDLERLLVVLEDGAGNLLLEVSFASARAYRVYAESDYWKYLNEFTGSPLIETQDSGCGVELSRHAPYLQEYRTYVRTQAPEEVFSCLIRTPDHCVEVICFEEPSLRLL